MRIKKIFFYTLSVFNNSANFRRNSACVWDLESGIVESVTESSIVEDGFPNSTALCDTGSTISNGFFWRFSKVNLYRIYFLLFILLYLLFVKIEMIVHVVDQAKQKQKNE